VATFYESIPAGGSIPADIVQRPALAITMLVGMASGISAFITGLVALIRTKDRTFLVFVSTIIGAVFTLYLIAEMLP
jgi:hypothetical protein